MKWLTICGAGAVVGYAAVYFALDSKPAPEAQPEQPVAAQPAEPAVLAHVVEVTDTDSLLDPRPAAPPSGIPFDPTEPLEPASATPTPPAN